MEWNRMESNVMECEWNGMEWNRIEYKLRKELKYTLRNYKYIHV
jgi:hypothetical protein